MAICVNDIKEPNDVWVVHFFEEGDLANGSAGYAFIFGFETDLFEGDYAVAVGYVSGFVDYTVGS